MNNCHVCWDPVGPEMLLNETYTCSTCLNYLIRKVGNGVDTYPVVINKEPADLIKHEQYLDRRLLDKYAEMELASLTATHLRVWCANGHFVGERVAATTANDASANGTYPAAIGKCNKCQHPTCMVCTKPLDKDASLATIIDHGCKEKLAADRKIREETFKERERGKKFQFCPVCQRDVALEDACYHVICICKTHFCFKCGVLAIPADGHWDEGGVCPQYPPRPEGQGPAAGRAPAPRPPRVRNNLQAQAAHGAPAAPRPQARLVGPELRARFGLGEGAPPPANEQERIRRAQNQRVMDQIDAAMNRPRAARPLANPAIRNGPHPVNVHFPFDGMPEVPGEQGIPGARHPGFGVRMGFGGRMGADAAMQEAPAHANAAARGGQFAVGLDKRARRMGEDDQVVAAGDALLRRGDQAPGPLPQRPRRRAQAVTGPQLGMETQDLPVIQGQRQEGRGRQLPRAEVEEDPIFGENEEEAGVRAFGAAMNQLDVARRQRL